MTRKNATNDNDFSHQRNNDKERTMYFQEQKPKTKPGGLDVETNRDRDRERP